MEIEPSELGPGVDEGLALRIIGFAVSIAPHLDALPAGGRARKIAIAVLAGIAKDVRGSGSGGSRFLKGQSVSTGSVQYQEVSSWFSDDDRTTLLSLAGGGAPAPSTPIGSFPLPGHLIGRLWPEQIEKY